MADFSIIGGSSIKSETIGLVSSSSRGTLITPDSSVHVKGAYIELTASSAFDYESIIVYMESNNGAGSQVDIAIGGSGSEQIILADLPCATISSSTADMSLQYTIPISIPAGSRISARSQIGFTPGTGIFLTLMGIGGSLGNSSGLNLITTEGANNATTTGVVVDAGGVANTKGSYAEITASSVRDYRGFFFGIDHNNNFNNSGVSRWLVDIAIGGSGSEQIILADYAVLRSGNKLSNIDGFFIPIAIPAGSRIAVRSQSSTTTSTTRVFGFTFFGVS